MAYAVVDAQGRYGAWTQVYRTFKTLAAADAFAQRGAYTVLVCEAGKGDRIHATDAARYEQRANATRGT